MVPESAEVRTEVDGHLLTLTNLDKPLFPDGATKAEIIDYYLRIAPVMLPHLAGRCITRLRFPNGTDQPSFYEKNLPNGTPEWVSRVEVEASGADIIYPLADSPATLVWLANLAAIELHTPQWTVGDARPSDPSTPLSLTEPGAVRSSFAVVDLDPGPGITMVEISQAALIVATRLAGDGLIPFVKTSGSKGLQVYAAIHPAPWQDVVGYVGALAKDLVAEHPDRFVAVMAKDQRREKIYLDFLQNQAARNTISPYSLRAKETPRVATPLTWDEVAAVDSPDALRFGPSDVLRRVEEHGDLWADLLHPESAGELPGARA